MKTKSMLRTAGLALALSTLHSPLSTCLAQGTLTPPGAPAPTMKSLDQIEARTPIASAPFTITAPGSYYLTTNLTISGGDAITIATNGVTLDLNGFTITSTDPGATGFGIRLHSGSRNLAILNGHVQSGVTNNAGTYGGPGFGYGIAYDSPPLVNVRVVGVSVSGCRYDGIYLGWDDTTVVEGCTVRTVGSFGIIASTIKNSVALDCGSTGIYGQQVSDSRGECPGSSTGLYAYTAQNCYGVSVSGYGLYATTALNCRGYSDSGYGLYAYTTALNCYGYSDSGTGLYAYRSAIGCYGYTATGPRALYARTAAFCTGYDNGGRAIEATVANGCYAVGGTNSIVWKYNMP